MPHSIQMMDESPLQRNKSSKQHAMPLIPLEYIENPERHGGKSLQCTNHGTTSMFLSTEYDDLHELECITAGQSEYHTANSVVEDNRQLPTTPVDEAVDITTVLDNLSLAVTRDRTIFSQLIEANDTLTASNKVLVEQVREVVESIKVIEMNLKDRQQIMWDPTGYFWTHGYKVTHGHSSTTCTSKATGHKDDSTRTDIKGGCKCNKTWRHHPDG